jgi:hypothetical protein
VRKLIALGLLGASLQAGATGFLDTQLLDPQFLDPQYLQSEGDAPAPDDPTGFLGWVGIPLMGADAPGPGDVEVPNLLAENLAEADVILELLGLDTGTTTAGCSAEAANEVTAQNPSAGEFVALATTVDLNYSSGTPCSYDLTGIPDGWYSIPNVLADQDFVALMREEATNGGADWAYYVAGTTQGSANLRLDLGVIGVEATTGGADWARWAPGTQPGNTGNLQLHMRDALNADFQ